MTSGVSRNYARALFELAAERGLAQDLEPQVAAARDALHTDREARGFLTSRLVGRSTKKALLQRAFGDQVDEQLLTFLYLLADRGRLGLLGEIAEEYQRLARLARGVRAVTLRSAFPLDAAEQARVTRALEERMAARVQLTVEVVPSLIGGAQAVSEGQEIEFSIAERLRTLAAHVGGAQSTGD
jgi:F-type H+-transporting ATPase subunit delta